MNPDPATLTARAQQLTPFVSRLEAAVHSAVRALLLVQPHERVELVWDADAVSDNEVGVRVRGDGPSTLVVLRGVHPADRRRKTVGARFVRSGNNSGGVVRRARRGLTRPAAALAPPLRALMESLDAYVPYQGLRDEEFRKVSSSPAGPYGTLRLGYRCNQNCHFCWQDRDGKGPPTELVWTWLDELAALGATMLNITGGEPTTFSMLPELIERAHHHHGMDVSIQSNAIALCRPRYLARLVDAGLRAVSASYHAADATRSDAMTAAPGTHACTVRGIEAALSAGLTVTLTCVVERANVDVLGAQARSIIERFVDPFPDNPIRRATYAHPTSYATPGAWADKQVPFDVSGPAVRSAARLLRAAGVAVQVTGTCGFPLCVLRDEPELLAEQPLQKAIFDAKQLSHLAYAPACMSCTRRSECFGLRQEYRETFGDRGLRPFG